MTDKKDTEGVPELLQMRNNLYLGNYSYCIAEDVKVNTNEAKLEKEILLQRAHIGLGQYDLVLSEINDSKDTPLALRAIRLLARYLKGGNSKEILDELEDLLLDPVNGTNSVLLCIAATVYTNEGDILSCIKCCHDPTSLEMFSILVISYLRIYRLDLAESALKKMSELKDDATITQLTTALLNLWKGGTTVDAKLLEEAETQFQELMDKYGGDSLVTPLNGKALVYLQQQQQQSGKYDSAHKLLLSALAKKAQDPETLANLVSCSLLMGKSLSDPSVKRYIQQLKNVAPKHMFVSKIQTLEDSFQAAMIQYK
jgi:coatomer protein complex subunit epsilon